MNSKPTTQLIIKTPFNGGCQTLIVNGKVLYSQLSIEDYMKKDSSFKIVSEAEYEKLHSEYWSSPFSEISEEDFWDYYEQLPPVKPTTYQKRFFVDFCSEPTSGLFHAVYLIDHKTEKYYTARISILSTEEEIVSQFTKEILNKEGS